MIHFWNNCDFRSARVPSFSHFHLVSVVLDVIFHWPLRRVLHYLVSDKSCLRRFMTKHIFKSTNMLVAKIHVGKFVKSCKHKKSHGNLICIWSDSNVNFIIFSIEFIKNLPYLKCLSGRLVSIGPNNDLPTLKMCLNITFKLWIGLNTSRILA